MEILPLIVIKSKYFSEDDWNTNMKLMWAKSQSVEDSTTSPSAMYVTSENNNCEASGHQIGGSCLISSQSHQSSDLLQNYEIPWNMKKLVEHSLIYRDLLHGTLHHPT